MRKIWFDEAWEDYLYWQVQDKKTLKRINALLKDIERNNFDGIGKPEPLKGDLSDFGADVLTTPTDWCTASTTAYLKSCHVKDIMMIDWEDGQPPSFSFASAEPPLNNYGN